MRATDLYEMVCHCGETVQSAQAATRGTVRCSCGRVLEYEWHPEEKKTVELVNISG